MRKYYQNNHMNKILQFFFTLFIFSNAYAAAPSSASGNYGFVSADDEIAVNIEKGTAEVKFQVSLKNVSDYDHVVVEKSIGAPGEFGKCSYIACDAAGKSLSGVDKTPYSKSDVYYRVKTINKQGVEKTYPPVLVPAAK